MAGRECPKGVANEMAPIDRRSWLILGDGSAIARGFAQAAAVKGYDMVLAGPDIDELEKRAAEISAQYGVWARALPFYPEDTGSHAEFIECLRIALPGHMDVFLCLSVDAEQDKMDADPDLAVALVTVNYVGAISILQRIAARVEGQGGGRIMVVGSVAGYTSRNRNYVRRSAAAGLNLYCTGLRFRLRHVGARITTVKLGVSDTILSWLAPGLFQLEDTRAFGEACLRASERGAKKVYPPGFWQNLFRGIRNLPCRAVQRVVSKYRRIKARKQQDQAIG